ncbi:MAG: hypothetical protein KKD31_19370, partial [Bacteroidetes bacterium]|nr:hypothetical protein [Bacteroidota bacterium]
MRTTSASNITTTPSGCNRLQTIRLAIGSIVFGLLILFAYACRQGESGDSNPGINDTTAGNSSFVAPKVIVVNRDSLAETTPGKNGVPLPKIVKAGTPAVVPTNTNVYPVGEQTVIKAGEPRVCTPGQDTFLLPQVVPALDSAGNLNIRQAGIPEVAIAKDPYIRDQNPQNFSSFSKLQGLKHDVIRCMLQDRTGNLWFGTYGGGVSKYDGETFTHFTEKEGLSNNYVLSILEDKSGNLWFGTYGGVSKYDGETFTHFTEKEGLSNNYVRSILEDKSGNLWFGTYGGVSKYDGETFTHFTEKEGLSNNY